MEKQDKIKNKKYFPHNNSIENKPESDEDDAKDDENCEDSHKNTSSSSIKNKNNNTKTQKEIKCCSYGCGEKSTCRDKTKFQRLYSNYATFKNE